MEKQKNDAMEKSFPQEKVNPQAQEVLYLTGGIKPGRVVNKKVVIKEAVSVTAPLLLQDCEIVFEEDVQNKDRGFLQVQNYSLEIKGGSIHYEGENKNESALFHLSNAQIKLDGVKVICRGRFIETDADSTITLENADFEDLSPDFIVQSTLSAEENLELHINNCTFKQNNSLEEREPLLNISHISELRIKEAAFQNFNFPVVNIRLYSTVRNIEISGTTFNNCSPSDYLIRVNGGFDTKLLLDSCTFSGCSALYFADDPIEIKNCTFNECGAVKKDYSGGIVETAQGGAIHFDCYDYGKIENCTFKNCTAIIERNDLLTKMTGLTGLKNSLTGDGGAVYIDINPYHSKNMQINNCEFISCHAAEKGGAVCVTQEGKTKKPIANISGCRFVDCEAKEGSAVHHLSMITGDYKWQTKEKPFISAKISDAVYKNCESLPKRQTDFESKKENSSEERKNVNKIINTIFAVMETVIRTEYETPEERDRFFNKITELEDELTFLKDEDPEKFDEIEKKIEELETRTEIQETYEEIKEDFKTLVDDLITDFKEIFE